MNYKLIPRLFYSLELHSYLPSFNKKALSFHEECQNIYKKDKILFFNSARVGLRLLLSSISNSMIKVGVQAYTCHTVFQAIHKAGHEPVFIDLTDDMKLDLDDLSNKINIIDVLIVTHTFGFSEDMKEIKKLVGDIIIIEDCSHSFLSKYKGKYTGTLGHAAIFSMGLGKFPPIGAGGFCLVNQPDKFPFLKEEYAKIPECKFVPAMKDFLKVFLYSLMMRPPIYGTITYKIGKNLDSKIDFVNKFSFSEVKGYKWVQRIFRSNFSLFQRILLTNTKNAKALSSLLKINNPVLFTKESIIPNYYAFPILIEDRDRLFQKLLASNIEPGKHFHKSIEWASEFGYVKGECPNTEKIIERIITVPNHFGVSENHIIKIAKIINESCI